MILFSSIYLLLFVLVYCLFCVCGSETVNLHSPPAIVVQFSLKGSKKIALWCKFLSLNGSPSSLFVSLLNNLTLLGLFSLRVV